MIKIIFSILVFFFINQSYAINLWSEWYMPTMYWSWWWSLWVADTYVDGRDSVFWQHSEGDTIYWKSLACLYNTWTLTNDQAYQVNPGWWLVQVSFSGWWLWEYIRDKDWSVLSDWEVIWDLTTWTWSYPDSHVICGVFDYIVKVSWWEYGSYFYSQNWFIYNDENWYIVNQKEVFTGSNALWIKISNNAWFSPKYFWGAYRYDFNDALNYSNEENAFISDMRQNYLKQFLTWVTLDTPDIHYPMWYYFWSKWVYIPGWSWTWSTWFFGNCTSFINVWCYIQWLYNATISFLWSFFPSIEWTGNSSSCISFSWSTASGVVSPVSYSWSNSYLQNVVNLFSLAMPLPPPEWSDVCLLWWSDIWWNIYSWANDGIVQMEYWKYIDDDMKIESFWNLTVFDLFVLVIVWFCWLHILSPKNGSQTDIQVVTKK